MNRNEEYLELMKELEENTPDLTVCVTKARMLYSVRAVGQFLCPGGPGLRQGAHPAAAG